MTRFLLRRLAWLLPALLVINFLGFAYAHLARPLRAARNPTLAWITQTESAPLLPAYTQYAQRFLKLDFGRYPPTREPLTLVISRAAGNSLGLLCLALTLSTVLGLTLALLATRPEPPRIARWLTIVATSGLATPSFYLGTLLVFFTLFCAYRSINRTWLPISGFGWDAHLILPLITLTLYPTMHIAQFTAGLLVEELSKPYITAARGYGHTWRRIIARQALRSSLPAVLLNINNALRRLVGELILIEWLFSWPGLGNLLARALVPAQLSTALGGTIFLDPPIIAAIVTVFAALFLGCDLLVAAAVRALDPRLSCAAEEVAAHV